MKSKFNEKCDTNCAVHKLVTHNACLFCKALRNSPYHAEAVKDMSDDDILTMQKEIEKEKV
ncbi:MAG: hypothetical protein IJ158_09290 [Treponema sp.]|nr:hypothetical protein [Treponema sp.]